MPFDPPKSSRKPPLDAPRDTKSGSEQAPRAHPRTRFLVHKTGYPRSANVPQSLKRWAAFRALWGLTRVYIYIYISAYPL